MTDQLTSDGMVRFRGRTVPMRWAWQPRKEYFRPRSETRGVAGTGWSPAALRRSHFHGLPYLADGVWPECPSCGERLALCLQLNASDDPRDGERLPEGTFLQLFVCGRHCWGERDGQTGEIPCFWHLRLVDATSPPVLPEGDHPTHWGGPHRLDGWIASLTPPDELDDFYLDGTGGWEDWLEECRGLGLLPDCDAVGGFPPLLYGSDDACAPCQKCGASMNFLLSVYLYDLLGLHAYGWVLQCPAHPYELAFRWNWDGR